MAVRRELIEQRLKELDEILHELDRYRDVTPEEVMYNTSQRWIIERGIISAAAHIFDISDHILSSHYGFYANTYDESLMGLFEKGAITEDLYMQIRGLGNFRNMLIHCYEGLDPVLVYDNFMKSLKVFPQFGVEVLSWVDGMCDYIGGEPECH